LTQYFGVDDLCYNRTTAALGEVFSNVW